MPEPSPTEKPQPQQPDADPFDRLYARWAKHIMRQHQKPPSRARWDLIILRLILSEDPDRVRRYKYIESRWQDSLGSDAYELWYKTPKYTPNLTVPVEGFEAYEKEQRGSMRRLMETQNLLDKYNAIIASQETRQWTDEEKVRAKRGQQEMIMIGCIGMSLIAFMVLTVMLIIGLSLVK